MEYMDGIFEPYCRRARTTTTQLLRVNMVASIMRYSDDTRCIVGIFSPRYSSVANDFQEHKSKLQSPIDECFAMRRQDVVYAYTNTVASINQLLMNWDNYPTLNHSHNVGVHVRMNMRTQRTVISRTREILSTHLERGHCFTTTLACLLQRSD